MVAAFKLKRVNFGLQKGAAMQKPSDYIRLAKEHLGNVGMSDRELGEHLGGFGFSSISNARYGNMSDPVALKVAQVLGIEPGEVLMVARLEREKDEEVKAALMAWASKTLASMSKNKAVSPDLALGGMVATRRIVRGSASAKNTI
ncbi:MAG: hypothetical protein K2W93_17225 [Burkholderiaceae bacterium]|nr:hypothetical protein [Burkholderiaceae bacterium]